MILLDTHTLLWWINEPNKIPASLLKKIERHKKDNKIKISAITFWEMAMLIKKNRLALNQDLNMWVQKIRLLPFIQIISPDEETLIQSVDLPGTFHSDPADRILVATARALGATIITKDDKILDYPHVKSCWN